MGASQQSGEIDRTPAHRITVLIVDDHAVVRQGLRTFLELQDDIDIVGEASNGLEAIDLARRHQPDIVLLDLVMPKMGGVEATPRLIAACPHARVIILTSFGEDDQIIPAIRAGAQGYLLKDIPPRDLIRAVREAYAGKAQLHPDVAKKLMAAVAGRAPPPPPPAAGSQVELGAEAPADSAKPQRRPSSRSRRSRRTKTLEAVPDGNRSATPQADSAIAVGAAPEPPEEAPLTPAAGVKPTRAHRSRSRPRKTPPESAEPEQISADQPEGGDAASVADETRSALAPSETRAKSRRGRGQRGSRKDEPSQKAEPGWADQSPAEAPIEDAGAEGRADATKPTTAPSKTSRKTSSRSAVAAGPTVAVARVAVRRGFPELVINGEEVVPSFFFGNVSEPDSVKRVHSQMARAARAGVRVFSTLVELVCPMPPDDTVYEALDERVERIADADRTAYLMPRIVFLPMPLWQSQYPGEMQMLESGSTGEPSIASEHFWAEAARSLRLLIEHIGRTSYGARVIGYHLERGEWFQPAAGGFDRSYANREGFRRWLRAKYSDSEVALRAAWYDGSVQFYTAEIPAPPTPTSGVAFFDPRRERRWVDFMEYTSDVTADRILALADAVKAATDGNALVSVSYGYTWEFLHAWSGHLALERVLSSPSVDILSGPVSYSDRAPGCSGALPVPVDSVAAHGKLWISEDDTKTHLAPGSSNANSFNPRMDSPTATDSVHTRCIGTALAHQTGISWMDLWGEGWLDSDTIWSRIGSFGTYWGALQKTRKFQDPDVAALIDERSLCHLSGGDAIAKRIIHGNREALLRCGASVGFYLQSDVLLKSFPVNAKLYLFLNPYRLSEDERKAIRERLRLPGRTIVWMYAVGAMTDRTAIEEPTPDVVGINLHPQPWNSEIGTRIIEAGHPIVQHLEGRALGIRERLSPSYFVDDDSPGITVLGEYTQTGLPSLAVRNFEGWTSVFCGEPALTPELLRGLCRFAGVHLYTRAPEDYVQIGNGWLSMHILRDGQRTLTLPEGTTLFDIAEGYASAPNVREYRTPVRAKTSRIFYIGAPASLRKLGFDITRQRPAPQPQETQPAPIRSETTTERRQLVKQSDEMVLASSTELTAPAPDDDPGAAVAALREELTEALASSDQADYEGNAPAAETPSEARRRRRRRGGRGRGRRKSSDASADSASDAS
jgi:DNA-binding NarL/FixJ family response regulator